LDTAALIQTVGGVASTAVSAAALAVAFRVERRTAARFQAQMDVTDKITAASIQPVLGTLTSEFIDLKAIKLINYGTGTAVITSAAANRAGHHERNVADLFEFDRPILWKNYWTFPDSDFYLRAGQELILASLDRASVERQHGSDFADLAMKSWQQQLDGIELELVYRDVASLRCYEYQRILAS
jgi:hypothetical protein